MAISSSRLELLVAVSSGTSQSWKRSSSLNSNLIFDDLLSSLLLVADCSIVYE